MSIIYATDTGEKMYRIAETGDIHARMEVARVHAFLRRIEETLEAGSSDFWNVKASANGTLSAGQVLQDGNSIWWLYANHRYCVAALVKRGKDVEVLHICARSEMKSVEKNLVGGSK